MTAAVPNPAGMVGKWRCLETEAEHAFAAARATAERVRQAVADRHRAREVLANFDNPSRGKPQTPITRAQFEKIQRDDVHLRQKYVSEIAQIEERLAHLNAEQQRIAKRTTSLKRVAENCQKYLEHQRILVPSAYGDGWMLNPDVEGVSGE